MDVIDTKWREAAVAAMEAQAQAINNWLEHTSDLEEMFERDKDLSMHLRSVIGVVRTARSDIYQEAETLKAKLTERTT
jgi:hypothetical protein